MAIRKQTIFLNDKFYGGIDLGTAQDQNDSDNSQQATNALVFLALCMNGHWKVPLGYFLVHSFTGNERCLHNIIMNVYVYVYYVQHTHI